MLFFNVVKIFLTPMLLAAVFTSLFYPFYSRLLIWTKNRYTVSSLLCCLLLFLVLIGPIYTVGRLLAVEGVGLFESLAPKVQEMFESGKIPFIDNLKAYPFLRDFSFDDFDWKSSLQDIAKNVGSIVTTVINKTSRGTFNVVTDLFITLFTMFYFFRDGHKLVERIKYLSPLENVYEEELIGRFVSVSRATIKGTLLIGLAQGSTGALVLWLFGVESPMLWAVVMVILSVIPVVGAGLVLYPAGFVQVLSGNVWQGVVIMVLAILVVGNIDNLLRPRLVGRDTGMHDLMIFFSTLGGISVFGIIGFIIGPVVAVFFLTLVDIYAREFQVTLDLAQQVDSEPD